MSKLPEKIRYCAGIELEDLAHRYNILLDYLAEKENAEPSHTEEKKECNCSYCQCEDEEIRAGNKCTFHTPSPSPLDILRDKVKGMYAILGNKYRERNQALDEVLSAIDSITNDTK